MATNPYAFLAPQAGLGDSTPEQTGFTTMADAQAFRRRALEAGYSDDEIQEYARQFQGGYIPSAGLGDDLARGWRRGMGASQSALGTLGQQVAQDIFGAEDSQYGTGWQEAGQEKLTDVANAARVGSFREIGDVDGTLVDALSYAAGLAGMSAPEMAAVLGAGVAGTVAAGPAGGIAAGIAAGTPMFTGRNLEAQIEQGEDPNLAKAAAVGVGQAAVDAVIGKILIGRLGIPAPQAQSISKAASRSTAKAAARYAGQVGGAAIMEGTTEVIQEAMGMAQSNPEFAQILFDPQTPEQREQRDQWFEDSLENFIGGAVLGGGIGAVGDAKSGATDTLGAAKSQRAARKETKGIQKGLDTPAEGIIALQERRDQARNNLADLQDSYDAAVQEGDAERAAKVDRAMRDEENVLAQTQKRIEKGQRDTLGDRARDMVGAEIPEGRARKGISPDIKAEVRETQQAGLEGGAPQAISDMEAARDEAVTRVGMMESRRDTAREENDTASERRYQREINREREKIRAYNDAIDDVRATEGLPSSRVRFTAPGMEGLAETPEGAQVIGDAEKMADEKGIGDYTEPDMSIMGPGSGLTGLDPVVPDVKYPTEDREDDTLGPDDTGPTPKDEPRMPLPEGYRPQPIMDPATGKQRRASDGKPIFGDPEGNPVVLDGNGDPRYMVDPETGQYPEGSPLYDEERDMTDEQREAKETEERERAAEEERQKAEAEKKEKAEAEKKKKAAAKRKKAAAEKKAADEKKAKEKKAADEKKAAEKKKREAQKPKEKSTEDKVKDRIKERKKAKKPEGEPSTEDKVRDRIKARKKAKTPTDREAEPPETTPRGPEAQIPGVEPTGEQPGDVAQPETMDDAISGFNDLFSDDALRAAEDGETSPIDMQERRYQALDNMVRLSPDFRGYIEKGDDNAMIDTILDAIEGLPANQGLDPDAMEEKLIQMAETIGGYLDALKDGSRPIPEPAAAPEPEAEPEPTPEPEDTGEETSTPQEREDAREDTEPEPTPEEIEEDSYDQGRYMVQGIEFEIETPRGGIRRNKPGEPEWEVEMPVDYGDIVGTIGADGDPVDMFVGDNPESGTFYIINQNTPDGTFDEHKVMAGFDSRADARQAYLDSFSDNYGEQIYDNMVRVSTRELKNWLKDGDMSVPYSRPEPGPVQGPDVPQVPTRYDINEMIAAKQEQARNAANARPTSAWKRTPKAGDLDPIPLDIDPVGDALVPIGAKMPDLTREEMQVRLDMLKEKTHYTPAEAREYTIIAGTLSVADENANIRHEHAVGVTQNGRITGTAYSGDPNATPIPDGVKESRFVDSDVVGHHNHPLYRSDPLPSVPGFSVGADLLSGVRSLWAHPHSDVSMVYVRRAAFEGDGAMTPAEWAEMVDYAQQNFKFFRERMHEMKSAYFRAQGDALGEPTVTQQAETFRLMEIITPRVLDELGYIYYADNAKIPEWLQDTVEPLTKRFVKRMKDSGFSGPTATLRPLGGTTDLFEQGASGAESEIGGGSGSPGMGEGSGYGSQTDRTGQQGDDGGQDGSGPDGITEAGDRGVSPEHVVVDAEDPSPMEGTDETPLKAAQTFLSEFRSDPSFSAEDTPHGRTKQQVRHPRYRQRVTAFKTFLRTMESTPQGENIKDQISRPFPDWNRVTQELIDYLVDTARMPFSDIAQMNGFLSQFFKDVRDGKVDIYDNTSSATEGNDRVNPDGDAAYEVDYEPRSKTPFPPKVETIVQANLQAPILDALEDLEAQVGDLDAYVGEKLGYPPSRIMATDGRPGPFSKEQIDALALSIYNYETTGQALILGDQTGIGKGRVVAGMIRYARLNDMTPVFVTKDDTLSTDMLRDLNDIDELSNITPLLTQRGLSIPVELKDPETGEAFESDKMKSVPNADYDRYFGEHLVGETKNKPGTIVKTKRLPEGYNALFTTYDNLNDARGEASTDPDSPEGTDRRPRADALQALVEGGNTFMIMDESHLAAGAAKDLPEIDSGDETVIGPGRANYFRHLVNNTKGVMFSSATYAKNPAGMALYAPRTAMAEAIQDPNQLIATILSGGVPLQQIVTGIFSRSKQYIRRGRTLKGVDFGTKTVPVEEDAVTTMGLAHTQLFQISDTLKSVRQNYGEKKAMEWGWYKTKEKNGKMSIDTRVSGDKTSYASQMWRINELATFAMKSDAIAQDTIERVKNGEKVVIGMQDTMGAALTDLIKEYDIDTGDNVSHLSFRDILKAELLRTRTVRVRDPNNTKNDKKVVVPINELGVLNEIVYRRAEAMIERIPLDIPFSPIDHIGAELKAAGIKYDEMTGRSKYIAPDGTLQTRQRKKTTNRENMDKFNSGELDVLFLNQSGSTGVSLHASQDFADQKPRTMIIAQPMADIVEFMQLVGRIHRTGQVNLPTYRIAKTNSPAEARITARLMKKLRSLNANTTADDNSSMDMDAPDLLNKLGSQAAAGLLMERDDLRIGLGYGMWSDEQLENVGGDEGFVAQVLSRMSMFSFHQQNEFVRELTDFYSSRKATLADLGLDKSEIRHKDLQAVVTQERELTPQKSGNTAFADPSIHQKVNIRRDVMPKEPSQIEAELIDYLTDGASEDVTELPMRGREHKTKLLDDTDAKIRDARNQSMDREKELVAEAAEAMQEITKADDALRAFTGNMSQSEIKDRREASEQIASRVKTVEKRLLNNRQKLEDAQKIKKKKEREPAVEKAKELVERAEKDLSKANKDLEKDGNFAQKLKDLENAEAMTRKAYDRYQSEIEQLRASRDRMNDFWSSFTHLMDAFGDGIGSTHRVGYKEDKHADSQTYEAIITDIRLRSPNANPFSLNSYIVAIQTPAQRHPIQIPLPHVKQGLAEFHAAPRDRTHTEFYQAQTTIEKDREIVTGNILAGYNHLQNRGEIITFTYDGSDEKHFGVLLPRNFKLADFEAKQPLPINSSDQMITYMREMYIPRTSAFNRKKSISAINTDVSVDFRLLKMKGAPVFNQAEIRFMPGKGKGKNFARQMMDDPEFNRLREAAGLEYDTQGAGAKKTYYLPFHNAKYGHERIKPLMDYMYQRGLQVNLEGDLKKIMEPILKPASTRSSAAKPTFRHQNRALSATGVAEIVARMTGGRANVQTVEQLKAGGEGIVRSGALSADTQEISGQYDPVKSLVTVAMNGPFAADLTAIHESWHYLRDKGLVTPQQLDILDRATPKLRKMAEKQIGKEAAANLDMEEVQAYALQEFARGPNNPALKGPVGRVLERINQFFDRLANYMAGNGFMSMDDVFQDAIEGRMADQHPADNWIQAYQTAPDVRFSAAMPISVPNKLPPEINDPMAELINRKIIHDPMEGRSFYGKFKTLLEAVKNLNREKMMRAVAWMRQRVADGTTGFRELDLDILTQRDDEGNIISRGDVGMGLQSLHKRAHLVMTNTGPLMERILTHGQIYWNEDRQDFEVDEDRKPFMAILDPIATAGLQNHFEHWLVGQRARQSLTDKARRKRLDKRIMELEKKGNYEAANQLREEAKLSNEDLDLIDRMFDALPASDQKMFLKARDEMIAYNRNFIEQMGRAGLLGLNTKRRQPKVDENGVPVMDEEGNPVYEKRSEVDRLLLDSLGNDLLYIPLSRFMDPDIVGHDNTGNLTIRRQRGMETRTNGMHRFHGSNLQVQDPMETLIKNMNAMVDKARRNAVTREAARLGQITGAVTQSKGTYKGALNREWLSKNRDLLEDMGIDPELIEAAREGDPIMELLRNLIDDKPPRTSNEFSVLIDGKQIFFEAEDPMLLESIRGMEPVQRHWIERLILEKPKTLLTRSVSADPVFIMRNFMRDAQQAYVLNPAEGATPLIDTFRGLREVYSDPDNEFTVGSASLYDPRSLDDLVKDRYKKTPKGTLGTPVRLFRAWEEQGRKIELANRRAVYDAVLEETGDKDEALYQATFMTNYASHGSSTIMRMLTTSIPYLNARIQGMDRLILQAAGGGPKSSKARKTLAARLLMRGALLSTFGFLSAAMLAGDEDYEKLEEWEKDAYFHYRPYPGGPLWRVPKGFEIGLIFGTGAERLYRNMSGYDGADESRGAVVRGITETLSLNPVPQVFRPLLDIGRNRDGYTGRPIETLGMQNLDPEYRYRESTSELLKQTQPAFGWLTDKVGTFTGVGGEISPIQGEYALRGYTGPIGAYVLAAADGLLNAMGIGQAQPNRVLGQNIPSIMRPVDQIASRALGSLAANPDRSNTKYTTEFYRIKEEADQAMATLRFAQRTGDRDLYEEILSENRQLLAARLPLNRVSRRITELRNVQKRIQNSDIPKGEKDEQIRAIRQQIQALTQRSVEAIAAE